MSLPPPINDSIEREEDYVERRDVAPVIDHLPTSPSTRPVRDGHTNRRPVLSIASSFVQDSLTEHNQRVERGDILPFLPSPEPLEQQRARRSPIDWGAIKRSARDDEVPWSPEGTGSRQTGDSTWDGECSMPSDKLTGELNSMLNKRKRESSGSEYVETKNPLDQG